MIQRPGMLLYSQNPEAISQHSRKQSFGYVVLAICVLNLLSRAPHKPGAARDGQRELTSAQGDPGMKVTQTLMSPVSQ